jgi:hypothetical protein
MKTPKPFIENRWISAFEVISFILHNLKAIIHSLKTRHENEADFEFQFQFNQNELNTLYQLYLFLSEIKTIQERLESIQKGTFTDMYLIINNLIHLLRQSLPHSNEMPNINSLSHINEGSIDSSSHFIEHCYSQFLNNVPFTDFKSDDQAFQSIQTIMENNDAVIRQGKLPCNEDTESGLYRFLNKVDDSENHP